MSEEPTPHISIHYVDTLTYAQWTDPWTGRRRTASGSSPKDAEGKARDRIRLEWQRREEDRLTYGGERPSLVGRR